MKNLKLFLLIALAVLPLATSAQAPGTMIHGVVRDDIEPLMMCNVVEIDEANRIVAHGQTDMNGNFSFRIVNPKHKLKISYVGYKTQIIPINGTTYNIKLEDANKIEDVVIKATKRTQTSGLAIPIREMSVAHQTIDAKEFEGLGITTVDEALQGRHQQLW